MISSPWVSVIMATYNRSHLISKAIESVLAQDFWDFELIIVDDGSTDRTKEVVDSFQDSRIIYLKQDNRGRAAASEELGPKTCKRQIYRSL